MVSKRITDDLIYELKGLQFYVDVLPFSVVCSSYEKIIKDLCESYFIYRRCYRLNGNFHRKVGDL